MEVTFGAKKPMSREELIGIGCRKKEGIFNARKPIPTEKNSIGIGIIIFCKKLEPKNLVPTEASV